MAEKKKIIGICAAVAAVAILLILLLRGCGGTRVDSPTEPTEVPLTTSAAEETTGAAETEVTEETTEATEETTEPTETTEETEPEETEGSSGNSTPGGYNPGFGTDDDEDEDEDDKEEETFEAPAAGVVNNPYIEKLAAVPGQIDTVLLPAEGSVYYEIHGAANSVLTLENPDATIVCGETTCQPDEAGMITLPIGDGTEPVTIQLTNAAAAEVPCVLNFLGPVGSESNPEVLETVEEIPVALAEGDSDGYHYIWTVTETGELTLASQVEGYVITVTIGETVLSSADSEDGSLTFEVEKDQEVIIHVIAETDEEGNYPAVADTILGTLADKGTILNPYVRYLTELPAEIPTVEIPTDGYRVYDIYGAGETVLTIEDANAVVVYNTVTFTPDENGVLTIGFDILEPETAARLAISCSGEEAKAFTMHFAYPEGSEKNPIALDTLDPVTLSLAGGEDHALYCSWTAEKSGTVAVQIDAVEPETVICGISLITAEDAAAATETLETAASMKVEAGQTLLIRVETAADAEGIFPDAQITLSGSFRLKEGLEENPIVLMVPESSVTVPAGESLYCTVQAPGMNMTLTGEDVSVLFKETEYTAEGGQICIPCGDEEAQIFVVTNKADKDAVYSVYFDYPLGSEENPALLELGENTAKPEDGEGYSFAWTAEIGGQLTITSEADWSYTIENRTNAEAAAVTGSEASQMVEVAAGDALRIIIAGEKKIISFTASFFDPTLGTEVNPILLEIPENKVTLNAGETVYYRANVSGADMTLKGSNVSVAMGEERFTLEKGVLTVRCRAEDGEDVVFAFTNEGDKKASYDVSFAYPAGSVQNPVQLILGENTARAEAGAAGCYLTWLADTDGELTLTALEGTVWNCRIDNMTSDDAEASEGSDTSRTVTVHAGDELLICVTPLNPEDPEALPGGELTFAASFFDPTLGSEENPIAMNVPRDTITVPAGTTKYFHAQADSMILTLTGDKVTVHHDGADYTPKQGKMVLTCSGTKSVFAVTNNASEEASYEASFAWPEGHRENPVSLELEEMTCTLEAGTEGCYYAWTAEEDGVLTIALEKDAAWCCCISNLTTETDGEIQTSDDENADLTIAVKAGEELLIRINTFDPADAANPPAGTVKFTASFKKTEN